MILSSTPTPQTLAKDKRLRIFFAQYHPRKSIGDAKEIPYMCGCRRTHKRHPTILSLKAEKKITLKNIFSLDNRASTTSE
jgi:hypothetical protein